MTRGEQQQQHESAQHDRHGYGLTMPEFKRAVERAMDEWDKGADLSALDDIKLRGTQAQYEQAIRMLRRHDDFMRDQQYNRHATRPRGD
jgi:hypothetical protein